MKFAQYMEFSGAKKGTIGLEIETECASGYHIPNEVDLQKHWGWKADGSLRQNGVEYVFTQPITFESAAYKEAMHNFDVLSKSIKFIKSPYSSVHVHFNMLNKEVLHMMNFICLYLLFEELLTEYCGNSRYANLFCLNTSRAEQIYSSVKEMAKAIDSGSGRSYINTLNNGLLKYSGINIVPLRNFGSVEVRTHPGTTDVSEINRWVGMLYKLYERADSFLSPVEIIQRLNGYKSKKAFVEFIFQEYSEYLNLSKVNEKFDDTIWYVTSIACAVDNWKDFGNKIPKDKYARGMKKKVPIELTTWGTAFETTPTQPTLSATTTTVEIVDWFQTSPTTDQ